jgi:hypothetical protein
VLALDVPPDAAFEAPEGDALLDVFAGEGFADADCAPAPDSWLPVTPFGDADACEPLAEFPPLDEFAEPDCVWAAPTGAFDPADADDEPAAPLAACPVDADALDCPWAAAVAFPADGADPEAGAWPLEGAAADDESGDADAPAAFVDADET